MLERLFLSNLGSPPYVYLPQLFKACKSHLKDPRALDPCCCMVLHSEGLMCGSSSWCPLLSLCGQCSASVLCNVVIGRYHQVLAFVGSTVRSMTSALSCLSSTAQLVLLLLPVPKSITRYLFLKKNMTGHGLCTSHVLLKSGTPAISVR